MGDGCAENIYTVTESPAETHTEKVQIGMSTIARKGDFYSVASHSYIT